jgi:hypothetical protein
MGVSCTPVSTVDVAAGPGITVSFLGGTYTVSADTTEADLASNYKVYATEAARDEDNPSPSSGDAAWSQADDTLWWHDGTGWIIMREPEQTYTPTYTNVTLGTSPTREGFYHRSNGWIEFSTKLTLGTGGSLSGQPVISLPSGITLAARQRGWGNGEANDAGVRHHVSGAEVAAAASTIIPLAWGVGGTYLAAANLSGTAPMTWTTGDILSLEGRLKMATAYL